MKSFTGADGAPQKLYIYALITDCVTYDYNRDKVPSQLPASLLPGSRAPFILKQKDMLKYFLCRTNCWVISALQPNLVNIDWDCTHPQHWGFYTQDKPHVAGTSLTNLEPP